MAVDGTYNMEIDTPMGKQTSKLTLKTDGNALSGTMESAFGTMEFSGGAVSGDEVAWVMEVSGPMGSMKLEHKGTVTGDDISGEVKVGDFGTSPFKGTRI